MLLTWLSAWCLFWAHWDAMAPVASAKSINSAVKSSISALSKNKPLISAGIEKSKDDHKLTDSPSSNPKKKFPLDHNFIFVGGTHFSGTSITERLLSSQTFATGIRADIRSVNDTSGCHLIDPVDPHRCIVPENEGGFVTKEITTIYTKTMRFCTVDPFYEWGRCAPTFHLTEQDIAHAEGGAQGLNKRMMKDWSMWWNMDRRYLVEKDIPNMVQSRFLQTVFGKDKTYFIFMLRHPLASCKYFECNMTSLIEAWLMANDVMSSDLPYLKNYMVIHQESMNLNASGTVDAIRKFLGWSELNYIDKSNKLNFRIDRWSIDMTLNSRRSLFFHGATEFPEDCKCDISVIFI